MPYRKQLPITKYKIKIPTAFVSEILGLPFKLRKDEYMEISCNLEPSDNGVLIKDMII